MTNEIFNKATDLWGTDFQHDMVVEEVGEMLAAMMQYKRGRVPYEAFIEECADVYIMMQQMRSGDPEKFDEIVDKKMKRLIARVEVNTND